MARTTRLAILASTLLILGGCGNSAATPTAPAATTQQPAPVATAALAASPSPAASPSTGLSTLASAYSELAAKGNAAIVQCDKDRTAAAGNLTKAKAVAQECLTDYIGYVADLKAIDWGPVQPQADDVIAAMNKIDVLMTSMANANTDAAFMTAYDQLTPAAGDLLTAANALRAALGLPPVQQ